MGCNCGKNQSSNPDGERASANLKQVQKKRMEPPVNRPTFPQIPQLTEPRHRTKLISPPPKLRFRSTEEMMERMNRGLPPTSPDSGIDQNTSSKTRK